MTKTKCAIPPLTSPTGKIFHPKQKADLLASTFEGIHKTNDGMGYINHTHEVNQSVNNFFSYTNVTLPIISLPSVNEVRDQIRTIKIRKAPGPDGMKNIIIKNLSLIAINYFTTLIHAMFSIGYFPNSWKCAKVIAIPKPGKDNSIPNNNRPISLLSGLSKLVEKLLAKRLKDELAYRKILPDYQFGFRQKMSTGHAIMNLKKDASIALSKRQSTSIVLLDIEKAFDTVWHNGLLLKLIRIGLPYWMIKFIQSYITNRRFRVNIDGHWSKYYKVAAGVPQGSVLGPIFFLIYVHDLPTSPCTKICKFADDTAIYSSSLSPPNAIQNVQDHLFLLESYYTTWRIKINASKSESMLITRKRRFDSPPPLLSIYGTTIELKNHVKYLGVTLESNLKFNKHCQLALQKGRTALSKLWSLLGPKSPLHYKNKVLIFILCIRTNCTYNIYAWDDVSQTMFRKLQVFQNMCLRLALGLRPDPVTHRQVTNVEVHRMAAVPWLSEFAKKLRKNFIKNASMSDNRLISSLADD